MVEKTGRNLLAVLSIHPDNSTALAAAGAIGIIASVVQKKVTEHKALQVLQKEASKVAKKKYVETPRTAEDINLYKDQAKILMNIASNIKTQELVAAEGGITAVIGTLMLHGVFMPESLRLICIAD